MPSLNIANIPTKLDMSAVGTALKRMLELYAQAYEDGIHDGDGKIDTKAIQLVVSGSTNWGMIVSIPGIADDFVLTLIPENSEEARKTRS
jgi:hypothetical protein